MKSTAEGGLREAERRRIADFIAAVAGIQLPPSKHLLVETRLRKRQRALGLPSLADYIQFVFEDPAGETERIHLIDALTTNKTDFYREANHFTFLREWISRHQHAMKEPLHLWSAGCSSGEEVYTLAVELLDFQRTVRPLNFRIQGTDISLSCLRTARKATYPHSRIEPMPMSLRKLFLLRSAAKGDDRVRFAPEVCQQVEFREFNLLTGNYKPFEARFQMIFCRNVMIYFNDAIRTQLTEHFFRSLKPGGLLFIGHSESLADPRGYFDRLQPTIYQKPVR